MTWKNHRAAPNFFIGLKEILKTNSNVLLPTRSKLSSKDGLSLVGKARSDSKDGEQLLKLDESGGQSLLSSTLSVERGGIRPPPAEAMANTS
jgi:hypothetical protein